MIDPDRGFAAALAGRYRIEREIGRGGMATVWLALDLRHRRPVALKAFDPERAEAIGRERFAREIGIVARLAHPHIVPLFDSGEAAGFLWFVMPHVSGESLRARLVREGRLPVAEALRVVTEIASGIGHAHRHGIIHRDLKPENVLLADGIALVADFGIASDAGEATRDEAGGLTRPGTAPGTPRYASPEQILGGRLDARSDLYSLGLIAYELLAGRPPFDGPTPEARARLRVTTDPPTLLELGQIVPPPASAAIARALARAPEDRFETAARFAEALTVSTGSVVTPSAHAAAPAPHNLPRERTRFVGRAREREECARVLAEARLLTLTGIGGSGKTRLALRIAADALPAFPDGAWFVDLAPVADPARVASSVAEALGVREEPGLPAARALERHLAEQRLLLVLDNCEHVREAAGRLADTLLDAGDGVRIVATSREALEVPGERRIAVGSLALPEAGRGAVADAEAVRLFVDRAQAADARFELDAESAPLVAEICRRLDGIPLAIVLAASRVRLLSVGQIRDRLDDRFRLLARGRDSSARHATLEAALDWSYGQLEPDEARLLRALSVFAGGWTLEAAAAVSGPEADGPPDEFAVMDRLARLLDRSLITVRRERNEAPRYGLLETVRQYARARLDAAGETRPAQARHAAWFAGRAESAWRERIAREEAWGVWLEAEHDNLRAALDALSGVDDEGCLALAGALSWFWQARSHLREGADRLAAALAATPAEPARPARARALWGAAVLRAWGSEPAAARTGMEEALSMWRALGDRAETALALDGLGWARILDDRDEEARDAFAESLRLEEEGGDPARVTRARVGLAQALVALGEVGPARELSRAVIEAAAAHGDRRSEHFGHHFLADCALLEGNCERALPLYQTALRLARGLGDRLESSFELQGVAMSLAGLGRAEAALRYAAAAGAERDRLGSAGRMRFWDALLVRWLGAASAAVDPAVRARVEDEGRALPFDEAVERAANESASAA